MRNPTPAEGDAPTWPARLPAAPPAYAPPTPVYVPASPNRASRPTAYSLPYPAAPYASAPRPPAARDRVAQALTQLISLALGIVESLLVVRIVLLLLAANAEAEFSRFVFGATASLVTPFQGVFPDPLAASGIALDEAAILAIIVYALLARLLKMAVRLAARL